ncbi:hypothetical protein BH10ACI1_BH10ACI1_12320 [soil metagenome]
MKISTTKLNEEKLKKYFLGKLSEAENEGFEEEIAVSSELSEEAQIVESELVDDYLRGNFSASDGELFEAIYLTTKARREKLLLAKSLWKVANEQKINKVTVPKTPKAFGQNWNAWRITFAGFATLLLLGAFIFFWFNSHRTEEITKQENTNQSPTPKAENRNIQPTENTNSVNQTANVSPNFNKNVSPTPLPKTTPTPKPSEQSAPTLASFVLLPGTLRDEGEQFIKISPNTTKINLGLNLPKDTSKYQTYNATIKTADGETIFTSPNLKSLNFTLSADKLENRTYVIFLEGRTAQNSLESVADYTFRVRR